MKIRLTILFIAAIYLCPVSSTCQTHQKDDSLLAHAIQFTLSQYKAAIRNSSAIFNGKEYIQYNSRIKGSLKPIDSAFPSIHFFPESGKLVHGINSAIAIRVLSATGEYINANGYLLSCKDTIMPISTTSKGMGIFKFIPDKNKNYKAVFETSNHGEAKPVAERLYL